MEACGDLAHPAITRPSGEEPNRGPGWWPPHGREEALPNGSGNPLPPGPSGAHNSAVKQRTASRLAWGMFLVFVLAAPVAVWLLIQVEGWGRAADDLVMSAIFMSFGLVGALVASRQPRNAIGWLFLGITLMVLLAFFSDTYARYSFRVRPTPLPGSVLAAWMASWAWIAFVSPTITFLPLLFPDGHLPTRRWRAFAWVVGGFEALAVAGFALEPGPLEGYGIPNPVGVEALGGASRILEGPSFLLLLLLGVISVASLLLRYRRAGGHRRQQIKWFAYAAGLMATWFVVSAVMEILGLYNDVVDTIGAAVAFASLPIGAGIGILKYRLFDIDVVINRTVLYAVLAAIVTALYVGIVVGIGALVGSQGSLPLSILATAIIALAFNPLRERARRFANRLVYGKRATPYEVLSEFGERLAGSYDTEDVVPRLARVVGEGVGAAGSTVWLHVGDELRPEATWPADAVAPEPLAIGGDTLPSFPGNQQAFEVRHQGELLGALTVSMPPGRPITQTGERLVEDLAAQAGLILRNVRLIEELRQSRQRIVAAQDEERRRLERNIHDGAQQQLVALAVRLNLAKGLAAKGSPKVADLLEAIKGETQDALENLRDLARGIYPPLLADKGLSAALESQARKVSVPVTVEPNGIGRYPQEAEAAAYFCVLEALQNMAKYADARGATVRLAHEDGQLVFEVADDGRGFDTATTPRGSGLQNMSDRLEALGGSVQVDSALGRGTTVTGRIPVR
jgi:signal transduction histidine kinase